MKINRNQEDRKNPKDWKFFEAVKISIKMCDL